MSLKIKTASILVLPALLTLALAGCSTTEPKATNASTTTPGNPGESTSPVEIKDAWVKAVDTGMSAAFANITNTGDKEITIVSATSKVSATVELHEMVHASDGSMVMQEREGGFAIAAGETITLEPGGLHLMLMDLKQPLVAGQEEELSISFADGRTQNFTAVVKDYSGANEKYVGDEDMKEMHHSGHGSKENSDETGHNH